MEHNGRKYVKAVLNLVTAVILLLLVIFLLPRLLGFFMPFLVGWVIAALANPLVRFFEQKMKIKRKAGSAIVVIAVIAAIIAVGYLVIAKLLMEGAGFISDLPSIWKALEADIDQIGRNLNTFLSGFPVGIQEKLTEAGERLMEFFGNLVNSMSIPTVTAVGNFAKNIPSILVSVIMCLLSSYFFVAERETIGKSIKKHSSPALQAKWQLMFSSIKGAVGGYFKAQLKIEVWIYLILMAGLWFLKVKYTLLIALAIAILDFLPIFGAGAVLWPWALVELLAGNYKMALGLMIIWGICQLVRQIIQPKIVGDSIGIAPLPTLFLLFVGYKLSGVLGMILAVPAGILVVNMDKGGLFDTTKNSIRILFKGFNDFRRLNRDDLEELDK